MLYNITHNIILSLTSLYMLFQLKRSLVLLSLAAPLYHAPLNIMLTRIKRGIEFVFMEYLDPNNYSPAVDRVTVLVVFLVDDNMRI